jgi:hypothetical protein
LNYSQLALLTDIDPVAMDDRKPIADKPFFNIFRPMLFDFEKQEGFMIF